MPEIGTSGSMSGDGKRSVGHRPQATAPILDSTDSDVSSIRRGRKPSGDKLPFPSMERHGRICPMRYCLRRLGQRSQTIWLAPLSLTLLHRGDRPARKLSGVSCRTPTSGPVFPPPKVKRP